MGMADTDAQSSNQIDPAKDRVNIWLNLFATDYTDCHEFI
jgi:hypothetical protein